MSTFLSVILKMTMSGSVCIILVIIIRLMGSKLPKRITVFFWVGAFFPLVCPFGLILPLSIDGLFSQVRKLLIVKAYTITASADVSIVPSVVFLLLWGAGFVFITANGVISLLRLKNIKAWQVSTENRIYLTNETKNAFCLGLIKPRIILPSTASEEMREIMCRHEQMHIRYFDHFFKLFVYVVLCFHWFNPMIWLAYDLFSRDVEYACDERVSLGLSRAERIKYASVLQTIALAGSFIKTPVSFAGHFTEKRIIRIMHDPQAGKISKTVSVLLVILSIVLSMSMSNNYLKREDSAFPTILNAVFNGKGTVYDSTGNDITDSFIKKYGVLYEKGAYYEIRELSASDGVVSIQTDNW